MAKTVADIVWLSPTHFVSNIRHQHRWLLPSQIRILIVLILSNSIWVFDVKIHLRFKIRISHINFWVKKIWEATLKLLFYFFGCRRGHCAFSQHKILFFRGKSKKTYYVTFYELFDILKLIFYRFDMIVQQNVWFHLTLTNPSRRISSYLRW